MTKASVVRLQTEGPRRYRRRLNVIFSAAAYIFIQTHQAPAKDYVDVETAHFSVQAEQGLEALVEPLTSGLLDQCAEATGLLKYRNSKDRIPFLMARSKRSLDLMIEDEYDGAISLTQSKYVENQFCAGSQVGTLFVTGRTISMCVGDEKHWVNRVQDKKLCSDVAHELVHIVQNELTGGGLRASGQELADVVGPAWLFEGAAVLFSYITEFGENRLDQLVQITRRNIPQGSLPISEMEAFDQRSDYNNLHYLKGFITSKFLLDRNSPEAFFAFYSCLGDQDGWEPCFGDAFGLSIDELYEVRSLR